MTRLELIKEIAVKTELPSATVDKFLRALRRSRGKIFWRVALQAKPHKLEQERVGNEKGNRGPRGIFV